MRAPKWYGPFFMLALIVEPWNLKVMGEMPADVACAICEAVAIIHRGRVVAQGAVADLERGDRPRLDVRVAGDAAGDWARQLDPGLASVERVDSGLVLLTLAPDADAQKVLDVASAAGAVEHFSFASRRLSEVFRDVTGEDA